MSLIMLNSRIKLLCLTGLLVFCFSWPVSAAPALKIISPPAKVTLGESLQFQVLCEWPVSDGPYEIRAGSPLFENLILLDQGQSEETAPDSIRILITLRLRAVQAGEGRILPFEVRYRKSGTESWQSFPVAGQKVLIVRAFPWKPAFAVLAGLLTAGAVVWGAVLFIGRRQAAERKKSACPPDPKQRVYAHAEEAILTFKGETQKETVGHWADRVKEVVATHYDIPSKVTTESEIVGTLASRQLPASEQKEVQRIFRELEQLKFTPGNLTVREMETLQKTLLQYVRGKIIIENSLKQDGG